MVTSGIGWWPARIKAPRRLSVASLRIWEKGFWEPVRITGLVRFVRMKESAEEVYAIVSVPWSMMNAS